MEIWKQGQFYPDLGKKIIEFPCEVYPGPSDNLIKIAGSNASPDERGYFISDKYTEEELDAIHTYGIARKVIDMYEKVLQKTMCWSWQRHGDPSPLLIYIRNNDIHARFLSEQKCIELDYYGPRNHKIFNCRTVDLVAHEMGHAILNALRPKWHKADAETRGMEEAFCDLTAMFVVLSQYDLCEEVIIETKGDLLQNSMLSLFGAGHGFGGSINKEIRSSINQEIYNKEELIPYSYCEVLVGALYEILNIFYAGELEYIEEAERLSKAGKKWMDGIVAAFMQCNSSQTSLSEFLSIFKYLFPEYILEIEKCFNRRNVY